MNEPEESEEDYQTRIIATVLDGVEETLNEMLPQLKPTWAEDPYLLYSRKKNAWWLALTDEEEFCRYLPWAEWEEQIFNEDPEERQALLVQLEALVWKLKESLA